jgi:hypothetical protein
VLTRERSVAEALASIAALAARLGVVPGALYCHARGNEQLHDLILDAVLGEADCRTAPAVPWACNLPPLTPRHRAGCPQAPFPAPALAAWLAAAVMPARMAGVLPVAGLGGLFHGSRGILFPGARWNCDQVGALAVGRDRGKQPGRHAGEPAEPDNAAARRAIDPYPAGPARTPVNAIHYRVCSLSIATLSARRH